MPVAKMSKISIIASSDIREGLVDRLHQLGVVQVIDIASAAAEDDELSDLCGRFEPSTREIRLAQSKVDFLIELLERFEDGKGGLISGMLAGREHLSYEEFEAIQGELDLEPLYRDLEELDIDLRHAESRITEMGRDVEALRPWKAVRYPLGIEDEVTSTAIRLLILGAGELSAWEEDMDSECPYSSWEEVHREGERLFLLVLVHRESTGDFDEIAQRHDAESVRFEGKAATPAEEMELLEKAVSEESERKEEIEEQIKERMPLKPKLLALYDFYGNLLIKEEVKENFIHTERAVAVEGWVERSREVEIGGELRALDPSLDITFKPPDEDDVPPTLLTNRPRIRPSETLIQLFGIPDRSETDPTPFVAPFFILFFGMCIGDVGYGAILALAFWLALKKLDVSENVKKFLRLFMYCGIASIVVGIFTVGYFGIESYLAVDGGSLPGIFKFPGTMDLLYEPIPFMLICLALGLIQISIGVAIEMYDNMRNNSVWLGICEQGTTLVSWLGLAVLVVGFGTGLDILAWIGAVIFAAGIAGIIFLSNIASKSIAGKFFGGLYNLYGLMASTIGDVASYLRLYALGLATIAIATVINIMARQVWGVPVLGILFVLIILLGGHLFNIAVSFLSAFVHPLRLQYVEFFSKFYEDGGEPFAPLALETSKIVIDKK